MCQGTERLRGKEMGEWLVGGAVRTYAFTKFVILHGHGSWSPKTISMVTSKITDLRSPDKYNKKVWNVRITKMWQTRNVQMLLENGAERPAGCKVATNLQSVKNVISAKHNKAKSNKMRYACINLGQRILYCSGTVLYTLECLSPSWLLPTRCL